MLAANDVSSSGWYPQSTTIQRIHYCHAKYGSELLAFAKILIILTIVVIISTHGGGYVTMGQGRAH